MAKEITKPTAQKRAAASAPPPRTPQAKPDSGGTQTSVPIKPEVRQVMICEAAYYIAEHRGFEPGHDVDDWLAAEEQIDAALTSSAPRAADSRLQR
jgi:Protein of unknown function (DUF2934)